MTTTAATAQHSGPNFLLVLIILILLAVIALPAISLGQHAEERHGDEAIAIRQCMNNNGPYQVWRSLREPDTFYLLCKLPGGKVGMQIVRWAQDLGRYIEKTAFVKGDGAEATVVRYLRDFATRFNGATLP